MSDDKELGVLDKPTVGDLLAALAELDPSTPLRIEDADTSWTIEKIHLMLTRDGVLFLSGEYDEMVRW